MFLTITLLLMGAVLTWWRARIWYVRGSRPPSNVDPRYISHYRPSWWRKWRGALFVLVAGGMITLSSCSLLWFGHYYNERWVTCHIGRSESPSGGKYRIQSSDCGPLDNVDTPLRMKFNSRSLQGQLKEGVTAELRVAGVNIPGWDWRPNVIVVRGVRR